MLALIEIIFSALAHKDRFWVLILAILNSPQVC